MKTPNLLDVPKDHPTRKERIGAFKSKHGIKTHNCGTSWDESKWLAVLFTVAWKQFECYCENSDHPSLCDLIAGAGRLVDEAGLSGYGVTEADAIRNLCEQNKIPCDL